MFKLLISAALLFCMFGCKPSDGIPEITDPKNPVDFNGKKMEKQAFLDTYCKIKVTNDKCLAVGNAVADERNAAYQKKLNDASAKVGK